MNARKAKIPVIVDTDIGGDIDDTWALAMLLNSHELDVRLITTTTGDTAARARIAARMLQVAGRTDIPIAVGRPEGTEALRQGPWVEGYRLEDYPGKVSMDSSAAIIDTIMNSKEAITVVAIGPLSDLAAALAREPLIAQRARFVGMHGSIYRGHELKPAVMAEYNVRKDPAACRAVFSAPWDKTITPLDTCGWVRLSGPRYQQVVASPTPLAKAVIENYRIWLQGRNDDGRSSILYDTVAVYLAFATNLLELKLMGIRVTADGMTVPDPAGPQVNCALNWKDVDAFYDILRERVVDRGPA